VISTVMAVRSWRDRHQRRQGVVGHVEPALGVHRDRLRQPEALTVVADPPGAEMAAVGGEAVDAACSAEPVGDPAARGGGTVAVLGGQLG
jgi:hypothetical protein